MKLLPGREQRGDQPLPAALARTAAGFTRRRLGATDVRVRLANRNVFFDLDLRTPMGLHIYRHGWHDTAADALDRLAPVGGTVVDGGANIGGFTLMAASAVGPTGSVHAVEASPGTAALLRRSVAANPEYTIHVHEAALADRPGELEFSTFEPGSGVSSLAPLQGGDVVRVPATTLDLLTEGLPRVDVVKLDLEGAELRALEAAREMLSRLRPTLILEFEPDHLERQGGTAAGLEALLRDAGYEGFELGAGSRGATFAPLASPWQRPSNEPNIVAVPSERSENLRDG